MKRLGLIGADGRMGQAVKRLAEGHYEIAAEISQDNPEAAGLSACDLVIDFSAPEALVAALPYIPDGALLVSGTTGLSEDQEAKIEIHAKRLAILRSGNFSLGINILCRLAEQAARALGPNWDIEIVEMHHRHKVDAPSGTALMLGEACASGRGVDLSSRFVIDRGGARREGDIGFSVLRGGGVYGDHDVRLVSGSEMISLGHRALNRDVFADGALSAARALLGKPPGVYSMMDVLPL